MDPNSRHQFWGKWTLTARRPLTAPSAMLSDSTASTVQLEWSKIVGSLIGNVGRARMTHKTETSRPGKLVDVWILEALVEELNQNDPTFEAIAKRKLTGWAENGFGVAVQVSIEYMRMAGDGQDGKPPDQMLILDQPIESISKLYAN